MSARSAKRRVEVHVFPAFRGGAPASWARRAAAAALAAADPDGERGVSVVVADDETLRGLNRRFRGLDEVTDVLSFGERGAPLEEGSAFLTGAHAGNGGATLGEEDERVLLSGNGNGAPAEFPAIPGETPSLGEVALSYPYAARQAASRNLPVEREVALLIVHGVLHLLGHDHAEPDEAAAMRAMEAEAMDSLFAAGSRGEGALADGEARGAPAPAAAGAGAR